MKKSLIVFLILGMFTYSYAGTTGKLAGTIIDKQTGEPLMGVNVVLQNTQLGAATDIDGQYFIVNIPVGSYTVEVSFVGYHTQIIKNVEISADLTTKIHFEMVQDAIELSSVEVVAEKPPVQRDLTSTINIIDANKVQKMPVVNYREVIGLQTGVVVMPIRLEQAGPYGQFNSTPDDGLHFRGGRSNETAYLFNGISIKDPIWGGFRIDDIPIMGLNQMVTYTGTYNAEYGEGMSAVMNMIAEPSMGTPKMQFTSYTDKIGINIEERNMTNTEFSFRGAVPGLKNKVHANLSLRYYTDDGRFFGYIYPNYRDTEGYDKTGDPEVVPMAYNDLLSGIGSLNFTLSSTMHLIAGGMYVDKQNSVYNHFFKYNPYGNPRVKSNYWLGYLQFKHVLSKKYFYDVSLSRYQRDFHSATFDDLETGLIEQHLLSPENFSVSGIDYVWFDTKSATDEFKVNFLGQISKIHQIKAGFSMKLNHLDYQRRNPTAQDADTSVYRMKAWEAYTRNPWSVHGYVQDKMEFDNIGMILNIGLRYDRIYPETFYLKDILRPTESDFLRTTYKEYFSPRLGVSYPIGDGMAFHFAYGIYYQYPNYYLVYQGTNDEEPIYPRYGLSEVTQIGNGNIDPEKTTSYEAGIQIAVNDRTSLNITVFYRDMADLVGLKTIYGPRTYQLFTNDAYGIAKGIELSFNSQFTRNFNMFINYTYSAAQASKQSAWYIPLFPQNRTFVADWDIPHSLSFNLNYVTQSMFGVSLIGNMSSGYPYSPNSLNPNSERGPMQSNLDMNVYKQFSWLGFRQTFFVQITNIFNKRNVYWVYSDTGKPGVDANEGTSYDYTNDPTAWGPPRQIRIGITLNY